VLIVWTLDTSRLTAEQLNTGVSSPLNLAISSTFNAQVQLPVDVLGAFRAKKSAVLELAFIYLQSAFQYNYCQFKVPPIQQNGVSSNILPTKVA
jgi:hypothetical protein